MAQRRQSENERQKVYRGRHCKRKVVGLRKRQVVAAEQIVTNTPREKYKYDNVILRTVIFFVRSQY